MQARNSLLHPKEFPLAGDSFERCEAAALELKTRTGDECLHRCGDQDLVRAGDRRDTGTRVHSDASELAVHHLALSGVDTRPHLEAELIANRLHDHCGRSTPARAERSPST